MSGKIEEKRVLSQNNNRNISQKKSMFNESGDEKRTNKNSKVTVFAKIATFLLGLRKCKRQNEFSWDQS